MSQLSTICGSKPHEDSEMNLPSKEDENDTNSELFEKSCRTCLNITENMISLFRTELILKQECILSDVLMDCTSLVVLKDDGKPDKICTVCLDQIKNTYIFRKLCEQSDNKLNESLSKNNYAIKKENKTESENSDDEYNGEEPFTEDIISADTDHSNTKKEKPKRIRTIKYKINNKTKTFKCDKCSKLFRDSHNLKRHKLTHNREEKPYLCNICGKGYSQLSYLRIHTNTHTGERPYKCEYCEKSFSAPGTLVTHTRIHTGTKPCICNICGRGFSQSSALTSHIRSHTGISPFQCKVCQVSFKQSGKLVTHMRKHSGEKPFKCQYCPKSFAAGGILKNHIRIHTLEKPFVCNFCGQAFAQRSSLYTHIKVHHKEETPTGSVK